ncbi:hypothetical protein AAG570_002612 [Ranatra chinensis]|uniref:Uncharacterized protein n=1 Tax=Ranatra chinensis TaxID=642074 RepID=A0ABD0Y845_9HEMI
MCPARTGALHHVERYIGSCLISAADTQGGYKEGPRYRGPVHQPPGGRHRRHDPDRQYTPGGWTAGVPLVAVADHARPRHEHDKRPQHEHRSPLSRLAVHTQGAPLIRAGVAPKGGAAGPRTPYDGRVQAKPSHHRRPARPDDKQHQAKEQQQRQPSGDSLSVVSDESSANSENTLPRIIKPRKRRKKDRKPPQPPPPPQAESPVRRPENSAIVTLKPYTPLCYETYEEEPAEEQRAAEKAEAPSSCQCRYCDPAGVIWDVERRCYSPFLTPPAAAAPAPAPPPPPDPRPLPPPSHSGLEFSSEIVTSPNGHRDIEIKFFSSSPPPRDVVVPPPAAPVTPPWPHYNNHHHHIHLWDYTGGFVPEE